MKKSRKKGHYVKNKNLTEQRVCRRIYFRR